MSSGRVQLAAVGLQDSFLTGDPDVTYFIKKFNRHTKFALEVLNTTFFQTNIDFGSWVNTIIPRNGQLIRTIYVKLVLPALSVGGYTNGIGNAIIEHADLVIGGQTIERINGEYMQLYDQTFVSDSQQEALTYLVGTTNGGLYGLGPAVEYGSGQATPEYGWYPRTFIVPLPFFFIRNEALSIPLCSLTRQEVEIRIKFRPLTELIAGGYVSSPVVKTTGINWTYPPSYPSSPASNSVEVEALQTVTWLPQSLVWACIPTNSKTSIYYYDYNTNTFDQFSNFLSVPMGKLQGIAQNDNDVIIIISDNDGSPTYNAAISYVGFTNKFTGLLPNSNRWNKLCSYYV